MAKLGYEISPVSYQVQSYRAAKYYYDSSAPV